MATLSAVAVAILSGLLALAPPAAGPECSDIDPNTRMCRTSGHVQIVTSPDPAMTNGYPGWGFGGIGFGLGNGAWLGF
jgi:hypothetical protein